MKRAVKVLEVLTWVLVLLLIGVTLDVSFNDARLSREYLPHVVVEKIEALQEKTRALTGINDPVKEAFERYLNEPRETAVLENLSSKLKGRDLVESTWNILLWEDEHVSYDYGRTEPQFRPPSEVIRSGKGICGDYSLLTAGLLLAMNYSPVYVLAIEFNDSDVGHLTAAIKVEDEYLVADQHPPLMDLAAYYRHWAVYGANVTGKRLHIDHADLYGVYSENGRVEVRYLGTLSPADFLSEDYNMSYEDVRKLEWSIVSLIREKYPSLKPNPVLEGSEKADSPPRGYRSVSIFEGVFPAYADYYLPQTHGEFSRLIVDTILTKDDLRGALERSDSFWVKVETDGPSLRVIVYAGRRM